MDPRTDPPRTDPPHTDLPRSRRRRTLLVGAGIGLVAAIAVGIFWFEPHKLFIDDTVDEALPTVVDDREPGDTRVVVSLRTESRGEFVGLDHATSGTALVLAHPDGRRTLRLEDLDTSNGPDLRVVLSPSPVGAGTYDGLVEVAKLKGNKGSQNYEIPSDISLDEIRSVVIWCKRFSSPFGEAPLDLA